MLDNTKEMMPDALFWLEDKQKMKEYLSNDCPLPNEDQVDSDINGSHRRTESRHEPDVCSEVLLKQEMLSKGTMTDFPGHVLRKHQVE